MGMFFNFIDGMGETLGQPTGNSELLPFFLFFFSLYVSPILSPWIPQNS